jgi:hypothetical protein
LELTICLWLCTMPFVFLVVALWLGPRAAVVTALALLPVVAIACWALSSGSGRKRGTNADTLKEAVMATEHAHPPERRHWWRTRTGWTLLGFLAIAGFFLFTEHRAHLLGALPFILLLLCPLLHLFGHGGLGSGTAHRHERPGSPRTGP